MQTPAQHQHPHPPPSLLSPIGYQNSSCGYCRNNAGSQSRKRFSYYASTASLTPEVYQSLLNRGWRRSGTLLYKPDQRASCCPHYTIRLDSESFRASKDQRQALNRFNNFIVGAAYTKEAARLYPRSRDDAKKRNTEFSVVERVHESEEGRLKTPPEPAHGFVVTLEPDTFTEEKYAVFENYQRLVHHEPPNKITKPGFRRFLCSSPLPRSAVLIDGKERRLGSYHQCYRIDGKLVAIGVIDLLPQCVSAVYFLYHESVHQHCFGKLGALREIALAEEDGYRWWYAGFYIHNCAKMRYKGDYSPQYVLDPDSYQWDLLGDNLKKKMDSGKYSRLPPERSEQESQSIESSEGVAGMDTTTDEASDSEYSPPLADPDTPLFLRDMPGILTADQLSTEIDLDHIKLRIRDQEAETSDLISWDDSSIDNPNSIKGIIAELVAAVGADVAKEMIVSFG